MATFSQQAISFGERQFRHGRSKEEQKPRIGLELGDRSSWYCILEERGEVPSEQAGDNAEGNE
jgi:hypothetical protein